MSSLDIVNAALMGDREALVAALGQEPSLCHSDGRRLRAAPTSALQRGPWIGVPCASDGHLSSVKDPDRRAQSHRAVLVG